MTKASVSARSAGLALLALLSAACAAPTSLEDLRAVLWVQRAAEYRAACLQTFAAAAAALPAALAATDRTAALEQADLQGWQALPPAVILDVDETALDNSPYNARLIADGRAFDLASWSGWVTEAQADAVPGAVAFTQRAVALGAEVYFVTNRDLALQDATLRNLRRCGFPADPDHLLLRGEHDDGGSEKRARRARVAGRHRVVMLLGDDLGDFVPGARTASASRREELVTEHRARFGAQWFVLPNPIYGSWTRSIPAPLEALVTRR